MQRVLVVDTNRRPLMPCSPTGASKLLQEGKAAVRSPLAGRSVIRRNRRSRKTRTGKEGRLPPSLESPVHNSFSFVRRLQKIAPILPKSKRGSDRVSNLTIASRECHSKKSNRSLREFLQGKPSLQSQIRAKAKRPLADASAVNSTGKEIVYRLATFDLPISCSPGGRAKFNRTLQGYPEGERRVRGFPTGDLVKAVVLQGKKKGTYSGRVAIRSSGSFCIDTPTGKVDGISYRFCKHLQHADDYEYSQQPRERRFLPRLKSQVSASSVL